jgi:hypothetical protein
MPRFKVQIPERRSGQVGYRGRLLLACVLGSDRVMAEMRCGYRNAVHRPAKLPLQEDDPKQQLAEVLDCRTGIQRGNGACQTP